MGLFDMFKGSAPLDLTPRRALVVSLIYCMGSDGEMDPEEVGHLLSVLGRSATREELDRCFKYARSTPPDAFLARMSEAGFARRFRKSLTEDAGVTLVAADRYGILGYASGGPSRRGIVGEGEISVLYLLRQAQGRGLGRALLTETARALAAQGSTSLMISVLRENFGARGFYEHLGGMAEPARREPGPGGALLYEVAYRWPDIRRLTD